MAALLWPTSATKRPAHSLSQAIYAINRRCGPIIGQPLPGSISLNRLAVQTDYDQIAKGRLAGADLPDPEDFAFSIQSYPSDAFDEWRQDVINKLRDVLRDKAQVAVAAGVQDHLENADSSAPGFVGRNRELSLLRKLWNRCVEGRPVVAVLSGPPGMGKSTLCHQLHRLLAISGGSVRRAKCSRSCSQDPFSVPTALIGAVIQKDVAGHEGDVAGALTLAMLDRVARPTAVVIENVEQIDHGSSVWLQRMLREADDHPLMIVLTVNTEDREDSERVMDLTNASGKRAVWLELDPFTNTESVQLIENEERLHGERLSSAVRDSIIATAKGNPLFLSELAREALRRAISDVSEEVLLADLYTATVDSVLRKRMLTLSSQTRAVVFALAVVGRCTLEELCTLTDLQSSAVRAAIKVLSERAMILASEGQYTLTHDLLRIAAIRLLDPIERGDLHVRAAEVLQKRQYVDLGRIARHLQRAGRLHAAFTYSMAATQEAEEAGDYALAVKQARLAQLVADDRNDRLRAGVCEARLLCLTGQYEAARGVLEPYEHLLEAGQSGAGEDVLELSRIVGALEGGEVSAPDAAERLKALLIRIKVLRDYKLFAQATRHLLTAAHDSAFAPLVEWIIREISADTLPFPPARRTELFILAANAQAVYGCASEALELLDRAYAAGASRDREVESVYYATRGIVELVRGQLLSAREELGKALRKSVPGQRLWGRERILTNLSVVELEIGDFDAAYRAMQDAMEFASRHERLAILANMAIWCLHTRRYDALVDVLEDLENTNRLMRVQWAEVACETFKTYWYLYSGHLRRARELADTLATLLTPDRKDISDRSYSEIAIARVWARSGRTGDAIQRLKTVLDSLTDAQWASRLRLQGELGTMLRRSAPSESRRILEQVRVTARRNGARGYYPLPG